MLCVISAHQLPSENLQNLPSHFQVHTAIDAVWDILIFATYSTSLNIQFISYSSFKIFGAVFSAILKPSKSNSFIYYCHGFRVEPERKTCYRRNDRGI